MHRQINPLFLLPSNSPLSLSLPEQEALIARLAAENTARNAQFRLFLLALPLLTALVYVPLLFRPRLSFLSLLSLTSLLSTAFLLYRLPPTATGIAPLDAWSRSEDVAAATREAGRRLGKRGSGGNSLAFASGAKSPLDTYLPYLNFGLGLVLTLLGLVAGGERAWLIGMWDLPAVIYGVVLVAKLVMGSVDPEKELSALKYQYKGA